jgi:hypothetical protein
MQRNEGIDPATFAASVRALLDEDPRRYRNFGAWWFVVKALLKRFYDRHEMPLLGDYVDPTVNARLPAVTGLQDALTMASEEYQQNASFNLGRAMVEDDDGELYMLSDPDMDG